MNRDNDGVGVRKLTATRATVSAIATQARTAHIPLIFAVGGGDPDQSATSELDISNFPKGVARIVPSVAEALIHGWNRAEKVQPLPTALNR